MEIHNNNVNEDDNLIENNIINVIEKKEQKDVNKESFPRSRNKNKGTEKHKVGGIVLKG